MARKINTDGQVGWVAWGSLIFCMAALFVILRSSLSAAFSSDWGVIWISAATTAGIITVARCRRFGLLTGLTLPVVFGLALALKLVTDASPAWCMAGLALGIYLALVGGRVAMHLIYIDQRSRQSHWFLTCCIILLPVVLISAFKLCWDEVRATPHGLELYSQYLLIAWGVFLLIWRPELLLRALTFILCNTFYHLRLEHAERLPDYGPVLIVSNHVSFLDALFIMGLKARKVTILIHSNFYRMPGFKWFFRWIGALEVPNANQPKQMQKFFDRVHRVLDRGGVVCMFPEGSISQNGVMQEFKSGVAAMLPNKDVPVIPMHLSMLWGSLFRIHQGHLRFIRPHKLPIPATVYVGDPIPGDWNGFKIWQKIGELGAEAEMPLIPGEKTIHHRFLKRAKQHPLQVTFKDYDAAEHLNNFQVLARSVLLSKKFRKLLSERNDNGKNMGIMLANGTIAAEALLALWFADRRAAMINYTSGAEAMQKMRFKAELKTIITSRALVEKLRQPVIEEMVFLEDIFASATAVERFLNFLQVLLVPHWILIRMISPASWRGVTDCATILFSSGSTGLPKGVMLSHHNLHSNIISFWREIAWRPNDSVLGNLPLFHVFGLMTNFCFPAVTGTTVVYVPNPLDGKAVCQTIKENRITLLLATPTFLQSYLKYATVEDFSSLRLVIAGAEKLQRKLFERVKTITGLNIVEAYGCTEMSPIVAINISSSLFTLGKESGPYGSIGVPMPGIAVKIIDPDTGAELGENEQGLLHCKGASVMIGYLDDPEATANAITPDGYYNTNDIATVDRNGCIRIVGRMTRFSKIAGEMVPHEMIERRIEELGHLDSLVAVAARPDERKGEQLVVFYAKEAKFDIADLLKKMRESGLPNLWIPRADCFFEVEAIPMLGNGKKDLKKVQALAKEISEDVF
ncbi:MAG: hypothetical protein E7039_04530 [Lentisphaerae bacterium]|nr:hypothetical protein [Lentisphaerota bacterium]